MSSVPNPVRSDDSPVHEPPFPFLNLYHWYSQAAWQLRHALDQVRTYDTASAQVEELRQWYLDKLTQCAAILEAVVPEHLTERIVADNDAIQRQIDAQRTRKVGVRKPTRRRAAVGV
jgi:hypothetical protein